MSRRLILAWATVEGSPHAPEVRLSEASEAKCRTCMHYPYKLCLAFDRILATRTEPDWGCTKWERSDGLRPES